MILSGAWPVMDGPGMGHLLKQRILNTHLSLTLRIFKYVCDCNLISAGSSEPGVIAY